MTTQIPDPSKSSSPANVTSVNPDSMTSKQGEFHPSRPRDHPETHGGHAIGSKHSPKDYAPEFSAKTLPPGSAPKDRTFTPNTQSEVPGQADNANVERSHGKESTKTTASSTLTGADSAQVHTGLGRPMHGQTANEKQEGGKKDRSGLESVGATGGRGRAYEKIAPNQKGLEKDEAAVG